VILAMLISPAQNKIRLKKIACLEASQWFTSFELLKQQQQGVKRQQHDIQAVAAAAAAAAASVSKSRVPQNPCNPEKYN